MMLLARMVLSAVLVAPTAAQADAVVSAIKGGALLSRGQGFERIIGPSPLKTGDRVIVTQGNSAKVIYPDNCVVDVVPGAIHIVSALSPCVAAQAAGKSPACGGTSQTTDRPATCSGAPQPPPSGLSGPARVVGVVGTVTIAPVPDDETTGAPPAQP